MKKLLTLLIFSNLLANNTPTKSIPQYQPQPQYIEVIVPQAQKEKKISSTTKFLLQLMRAAIAFAAAHNTTPENLATIQGLIEKYRDKFPELFKPGCDKLIDFAEIVQSKVGQDSIYRIPIQAAIFLAAFFATDISWEDFTDFLKTPIYLINSVKVSAALVLYYVAFTYYKSLAPEPIPPSDGTKA